jgi:uncharacterized repeat protein (TIGR01451 family)
VAGIHVTDTLHLVHTVENLGDLTETVTISASWTLPGWVIQFEQPIPYTITLSPGPVVGGTSYSATVPVTITPPLSAKGLTNDILITASSGWKPGVYDTVLDQVSVLSAWWEIGKAVVPATTVQPLGLLTYTLTVTNVGDLASTGVYTIEDQLPDNTHFVDGNPLPTVSAGTAVWNPSAPVAVDEAVSVTLVVSVTRPLTDGVQIVNDTYTVYGGGAGNVASGDSVAVTVDAPATLVVGKAASIDPVQPGDYLTYTITITNIASSLGPALSVMVTDTLPAEAVFQSMGFVPPASGSVVSSSVPNLRWYLDDPIPVGGSAQVTVTVRITSPLAPGTIIDNLFGATAEKVVGPAAGSLGTTINAINSVTFSKVVDPPTVATNGLLTYTVTLTNTGNGVADVTLTDVPGPGFTPPVRVVNVSVPGRSWSTTHGQATAVLTFTAPAVPNTYSNQAITATYDLDEVSLTNTAPVTVVVPALEVNKVANAPSVLDGDTLTYTLSVTNTGGVDLRVTITDSLPSTVDPTGDQVWNVDLSPDEVWTQELVVTVDPGGTRDLVNTLDVTSLEGVADSAVVTTTAYGIPGIVITKTTTTPQAQPGGTVSFDIVVENTASVDLTDVTVTDPLVPDCNGFYASLGAGLSQSYSCSGSAPADDFTNIATVVATPPVGPSPSDQDSAFVDVIHPSIVITKAPNIQSVPFDGTANFTITVENSGDVALTAVTVSDPLAPGCNNTLGSLPVGQTWTYNCALTNVQTDFTNVASVSASPPVGSDVTDQDSADVDAVVADITISKLPDFQVVPSGGTANFTIIVTNTGEYALTNVSVSDPLAPDCASTLGSLAVGESTSYGCSLAGVSADFINTANVSADVAGGVSVADSDTAPVYVGEVVAGLTAVNDSPTMLLNPVHLTATVTAGTDVSYSWDFGDNTTGSGQYASHIYPGPGLYIATATAYNHFSSITATTVVSIYLTDGANLVISGMWITPTAPALGETITVTVRIENQGNLTATHWTGSGETWFITEIYAKSAATPPTSVFDHSGGFESGRWDFIAIPGVVMAPGDTYTAEYYISLLPGQYYLYAQVDTSFDPTPAAPPWNMPFGLIPELDESNIYTYGAVDISGYVLYLPLTLRSY